MTTKTVAYTADQVAVMTERYTADASKATIAALAAEFGKTEKSVVAKLAQLGIYKKQEAAAKEGARETKAELVARITGDETFAADLAKLTKASIVKLLALYAVATDVAADEVTE
jgi:hypothetical protein